VPDNQLAAGGRVRHRSAARERLKIQNVLFLFKNFLEEGGLGGVVRSTESMRPSGAVRARAAEARDRHDRKCLKDP
jgi:hypothetical protein